jgi:hypothetical protein
VKVKLSLCLTKHHVMKLYPVFNETSRHEDIGELEEKLHAFLNTARKVKVNLSLCLT